MVSTSTRLTGVFFLTNVAIFELGPRSLQLELRRGSPTGGQSLYDSLQQCRVVLMGDGRLAIAPGAAQEKDVICLLQGGQSP
jgi:hypothetical protein